MSDDLAILSKKQGTFILNDSATPYDLQPFDVIKVLAATRLEFTDTSGLTEGDYISNPAGTLPVGTEIRPLNGAKFNSVTVTTATGVVEITI